jgi:PAS domain S-box-containing protein
MTHLRAPPVPQLRAPWRFLFPCAATLVVFLVHLALLPRTEIAPFVLFFVGVAFSAWFGGRAPGMLAVALSAAVANHAFLGDPGWSTSVPELSATALYVVSASIVALLCGSFRETALRAQRAAEAVRRQGDMLALSHDAILVWRPGAGIESWNRGAEELYGFTRAEALGRSPQELLSTGFPLPWAEIEGVLAERGRWQGELVHTTREGRTVTVSARLQSVRGHDGVERILETNRDITDGKRAAESLQRSEAMLRSMVEQMPSGVTVRDAGTGAVILANTRAREIAGALVPEPGDFARYRGFHADGRRYRSEEWPLFRSIAAGEVVNGEEVECERNDGARFTLSINSAPVRDAHGDVVAAVAVFDDVTERKRTEKRLRRLFDAGVVGILCGTVDGATTEANDRFLRMTGYTREDLDAGAIDWARITPPEWRGADERALAELGATGHTPPYEKEFLRKDGTRVPVLVGSAMIDEPRDEGVAFVIDITDRKQAEHALRASEAQLRAIFENATDAIVVTESEGAGRVLAVNPAACRLFGYGPEEFRGLARDAMLDGADPAVGALLEARRERGHATAELTYVRKDGTRFVGDLTSALLDDEPGPPRAVAIVRDITERRRAEDALRHANEQLRDADRRKDEFLAVLSHELRNPLAPIRNSLYVLDHAPPDGEQARRARTVIDRQVHHMTRLVADLLDVSRITRGKVQLQRERLDLREVLGRAVEDHRSVFATRAIALRADGPGDPVWVDGDGVRLGQAIGNLLHNAAKFTDHGGSVSVTLRRERSTAVVDVEDSGVGVPREMLGSIFEPFTQADRTLDRSAGGLGLGLALVKGWIELHGGTVTAASEGTGRGSRFTLRIPVVSQPAPAVGPEVVPVKAAARRVLVIEDNVDAATSLKEVLELDAHEVALAFSGPEGLETARAFGPDVVLCDVGLPGMSGYEIARRLRADVRLRRVALVALTGYALAEDAAKAREAGFDWHLAKPPDLGALGRILADLPRRNAA